MGILRQRGTGTYKNTIKFQATRKEIRKEDLQDRQTSLKGLEYNGDKKQASNGRPETVGNGARLYWWTLCRTDCSALAEGKEQEEEEEN
jgi:hypothetical protein